MASTEKNYPDTWDPAYKARAHESLGLFLAQYLCNGFNLTDAGRLQYNRTYFAEGGKAFEFMRKKTSARSNDMSVVIVPIIEPLQVILDEIGAKPELSLMKSEPNRKRMPMCSPRYSKE